MILSFSSFIADHGFLSSDVAFVITWLTSEQIWYSLYKQIRETPHKRHHKFVEYYDVRAADAALRSLNRIDIAGKRIKLEPSRPGGARRRCVF